MVLSNLLAQLRAHHPQLPVMVRAPSLDVAEELRAAGATEVVPEMLEATLTLASQALRLLDVPLARVLRRVQAERANLYPRLRGAFGGDATHTDDVAADTERLHALQLPADGRWHGQALSALPLDGVIVSALVRSGHRRLQPAPDTRVEPGDTLVLFGAADALARAEAALQR